MKLFTTFRRGKARRTLRSLVKLESVGGWRALRIWTKNWGGVPVCSWLRAAQLLNSGRHAEAVDYYLHGLKRRRKNRAAPYARLDLAVCYLTLKRVRDAERQLEIIAASEAPVEDAYLLLARIRLMRGAADEALEALRRGIYLMPNRPALLLGLVSILRRTGGNEEELRELLPNFYNLRAEIEDDKDLVVLLTATAATHLALGHTDAGRKSLARALAMGEAPAEAYLLNAEECFERGRREQGLEALRAAFTSSSTAHEPALALARYYLESGPAFNPAYAVQNATIAVQRSFWLNRDCLTMFAQAFAANDNEAGARLIEGRVQRMSRTLGIDEDAIVESRERVTRLRLI